ncbi:hypothetical protein ACIGEL_17700 [Rossellomorea aquimaris]|uniref:hypothetical protein n=1 Tax=Rossellomorea aquimaris TaxID=189382 RepID=UPI0037C73366
MTAKSMLICPTNIVTYYHDEIRNEERAKKIVQAERDKKSRIIPLVAEEVTKGEYVLIEKFEYYSALMKAQPNVRVPCLVYPGTSNEKRLTHILKICIPLEKGTSWLFKNEHVMKLKQDYRLTDSAIARKINCNTSTINRYILDTRIPQHIRERALKMEAKTVLEKIASSIVIPEEVKMILYKKAIIDKGNDFRLTGKKFEYMKEFCSVCVLPDTLLRNTPSLEMFLDRLIYSNFKIKDHMRSLFNSFSVREKTTLAHEDIPIH